MKKDKLYLFTFISLFFVVYLIGYFSIRYFIDANTEKLLEIQMESSKREAKEFSNMISSQLLNGISKKDIIDNIQKSIENTNNETGFICMFDWSGKEICHPNIERVGKYVNPEESFISTISDDATSRDFFDYLKNKEEGGGKRSFVDKKRESEIIYVYPVKNSDWIVAAHANTYKIKEHISELKEKFFIVSAITGAIIVILSFLTIRMVGSSYENKLELKNEKLSDEVLSLSKLNLDLLNYKTKISPKEITNVAENKSIEDKQRIVTYSRNELVPLLIEQIAYVYTENSITFVISLEGKKSTSNSSLDELFGQLNKTLFYRVNRQYILSIYAVDKIIKYGNSQLKIEVLPKADADIIISKNKAAEFKLWLNS